MNKAVEIHQVEFVLAVDKHNPIMLNPEFLKARDVINIDWELAQPPTYVNSTALVAFQNGVYLAHQGNIVAFFEDTKAKSLENLEVPKVIHRYLERLPQENYQAVGLNLEGHIVFDKQDEAQRYLLETLSSSHSHKLDQDIVQASLNLAYKIDRGLLTLSIRNTALESPDDESIPVVLFSANFHRDITLVPKEEQSYYTSEIIKSWRTDVEIYKEIIFNKFLNKKVEQFV
jgi:hypothetical protein